MHGCEGPFHGKNKTQTMIESEAPIITIVIIIKKIIIIIKIKKK